MTSVSSVTRARDRFSAILLVLLGVWGGVIPFVGPYAGYAYTPDTAWTYTSGRLWLSILPAAAVFFGGVLVLPPATLPAARAGGCLAAIGGAWFVVGAFLASASWQLLLAGGGSLVGRLLTGERGRLITALVSSAVIAVLAITLL